MIVVQPTPGGLRLTERGSAYLQFVEFRGSFDVVHFRYGPSVHLPQLPTPPRGDAVEVVFRREQSNSTGGTLTHVHASFPGAGSVGSCKSCLGQTRQTLSTRKKYFLAHQQLTKNASEYF